jgi:hypothetical protein
MNQDQVKDLLLSIEEPPMEFKVIFSGKKSRKVNGLYKCETREIILHNRNFDDEPNGKGNLVYTAIHEYAHHFHACARGGTLSAKAHSSEFWAIFHRLLEKAESKKIYHNIFNSSTELKELTVQIREKYLVRNGGLVKEFGRMLLKASDLCEQIGGRFEDYIDRVLRIPKEAANAAIRMFQLDLDPAVGADNMRYIANIRDEDDRKGAQAALLAGKSPDSVKTALKKGQSPGARGPDEEEDLGDAKLRLEKEKLRLERTISTLSKRLKEVKEELENY